MIAWSTDVRMFRRFVGELCPAVAPATIRGYREDDREAARFAWAARIVDEYRSVAVFSELLRLLADVEASFPAQCAVHRMIGDELRHTQVTAEVVGWLGGMDGLAIDLAEVGLPPREDGESALARAAAIVGRELVVAEEESVYALAAYRGATTEPAIRRVLDGILADEVRHAAAGRALFDELAPRVDPAALAALRAQMDEDRALLRAEYAASAAGGPGRALGGSIERADLEQIWRRAHPRAA